MTLVSLAILLTEARNPAAYGYRKMLTVTEKQTMSGTNLKEATIRHGITPLPISDLTK